MSPTDADQAGQPIKLLWLEHLPTHHGVTDGMLRTALRLARYADQRGQDAYPGPARIARETTAGWDDLTPKRRENRTHVVERQLRALTAAGVIRKTAEGGIIGGRRVAAEYALVEWWTGDPAVTGDPTVTGTGDPAVTHTGDPAAPPHLQTTPAEPLRPPAPAVADSRDADDAPAAEDDASTWADWIHDRDPHGHQRALITAAASLEPDALDAYDDPDTPATEWDRLHEAVCTRLLAAYDSAA